VFKNHAEDRASASNYNYMLMLFPLPVLPDMRFPDFRLQKLPVMIAVTFSFQFPDFSVPFSGLFRRNITLKKGLSYMDLYTNVIQYRLAFQRSKRPFAGM